MKSWQFRKLSREATKQTRLFVAAGKYKDNFCTFRHVVGSKISVFIDGGAGDAIDIAYTSIEELDEYGKPEVKPVTDMTGREITEGSYVCYSAKAGRQGHSHALEIGKVLEITKVGGLKVKRLVHNGEKISPNNWQRESAVGDPFRSIKLPVDDTTIIMWIMQDFEEMAKSK